MTGKLRHPAFSRIETRRDDVFAFEIDGHISMSEIDEIYKTLDEGYKKFDRIDLLVRMGRYDGFEWNALFSQTTYLGKLHALKHLRRYALVGGPAWFATAIKFFNPLFRVDIRHFELDEEADAWNWIYDNLAETSATR